MEYGYKRYLLGSIIKPYDWRQTVEETKLATYYFSESVLNDFGNHNNYYPMDLY